MPKKKPTQKKELKETVSKKNTQVAKRKPERKLAWGGVMPTAQNSKNQAEVREFCNQVSKVYGVPSMGVNVMGNQPYLNKDGRLFLLYELRKGQRAVRTIKTKFLQMSTSPDMIAVCKKTILFRDGLEVEGIGEASKENVALDAVKKTLNMMAETRALNRAIWQAIGGDVWNRVAKNLGKADFDEEEKAKLVEAGRISYEEVDHGSKKTNTPTPTSPAEIEKQLLDKIESCNNLDELVEYGEKMNKAKPTELLTNEVIKNVKSAINGRIDLLSLE